MWRSRKFGKVRVWKFWNLGVGVVHFTSGSATLLTTIAWDDFQLSWRQQACKWHLHIHQHSHVWEWNYDGTIISNDASNIATFRNFLNYVMTSKWQTKALGFLWAFEESNQLGSISSFCDDSNLYTSVFKQLLPTCARNPSTNF